MTHSVPLHFDDLEDEAPTKGRPLKESLKHIGLHALTVSLGPALAKEFLGENSAALLSCIDDVRREIARETGIVQPGVHFRDDIYVADFEYVIHVGDLRAGMGHLEPGMLLALAKVHELEKFPGPLTKEPTYGLPAKWIDPASIADGKPAGVMTFDGLHVLASHVGQITRDHLSELFTLDIYEAYIKHIATRAPILIEEFQTAIDRRTGHRAYRALLNEYVWPRDPVRTIETLLDASDNDKDPLALAEVTRKKLVPPQLLRRKGNSLIVCRFDAPLTDEIRQVLETTSSLAGTDLGIHIRKYVAELAKEQIYLNVLCNPQVRRAIAELFPRFRKRVPVYATDEIPREVRIIEAAVLGLSKTQPLRRATSATKKTNPNEISNMDNDGANQTESAAQMPLQGAVSDAESMTHQHPAGVDAAPAQPIFQAESATTTGKKLRKK